MKSEFVVGFVMLAHLASFHGPWVLNGSVNSAVLIRCTPGVSAVSATRPVRLPATPVPMVTKVRNDVPPSRSTQARSDSSGTVSPVVIADASWACVPLGKVIAPLRVISGFSVSATVADAVAPVASVTRTVQLEGNTLAMIAIRASPATRPVVSLHPVLQLNVSGAVPVDWRASSSVVASLAGECWTKTTAASGVLDPPLTAGALPGITIACDHEWS